VPVRDAALPQQFLAHGTRPDVLIDAGLGAQDIARQVVESMAEASATSST
jgi:1-deoxy-D-xylulose-5-phosphate synthase